MSFPVLWLCGPPGVGKSTVAWALFTELAAQGTPTGYVDIDQLGMCYGPPTAGEWAPDPAADPGRYRLKERNLRAVIANYHRAGAHGLVVSGITDPVQGLDPERFPDADITPARLRCEPGELRRRIATRGRGTDNVEEILRYAQALDGPGPGIDTTGRSVADVLDVLRGWRPGAGPAGTPPRHRATPGSILWLCGATAVGKSTVGFAVYEQENRRGIHTAFVDLDQIGFLRPGGVPGNHPLKAANLAAIWPAFREAGAEQLVVVGPVERADDIAMYRRALPAATITVARLHASRETLHQRIRLRAAGQGPPIVGNELPGHPDDALQQAVAEAGALDADAIGDLRVDTDGRSVRELAEELVSRRIGRR